MADRMGSRRDTVAFLVCLALAVAARVAPVGTQEALSSAVRSTVAAPLLALEAQVVLLKASRVRFRRVIAERDSAVAAALAVPALRDENATLRALLELGASTDIEHVSASILRQAGRTEGLTFVLSVGRDDGVAPGDPVMTPQGLLGVVRTTDRATAVAVAWPHPDFRVSAKLEDESVFGIVAPLGVEGPNTILLELRGVPYGDIVPQGSLVVTSGLGGTGGVYPPNIPIGTVLDVASEEAGWSRTYRVRAMVHPASVSHVMVLTGATAPSPSNDPEAR